MSATTGTITREPEFIQCAECGLYWQGWRGYRTDHPELGETPGVEFCCLTCSDGEFAQSRRAYGRRAPITRSGDASRAAPRLP